MFEASLLDCMRSGSGLSISSASSLHPGYVRVLEEVGSVEAAVARVGDTVLSAGSRLTRWGRLRARVDQVSRPYPTVLDVNPYEEMLLSDHGEEATVFLTVDGFFVVGFGPAPGPIEITHVLSLRKAIITVIPIDMGSETVMEWSIRGATVTVTCGAAGSESWSSWLRDVISITLCSAATAGALPPGVYTQELLRGGSPQHRIIRGSLFWAAFTGNLPTLSKLLAPSVARLDPVFGCSVPSKDEFGNTPLHYAAAAGKTSAIRMLMENNAPISVGNSEGKTPLHYACLRGDPQAVTALFSTGAAFASDVADADGNTVVHAAVATSNSSMIAGVLRALPPQLLCEARVLSNNDGMTPLHLLALRSTRLPLPVSPWDAVCHIATEEGHLVAALAALFCPDTPHPSLVASVSRKIANVTCTPLLMACGSPHHVVVTTDSTGQASHGHVPCCSPVLIEEFLQHGGSPNGGSVERKLTPLHVLLNEVRVCLLSVIDGKQVLSAVDSLLERFLRATVILTHHGAQLDAVDSNGTTPLQLCQAIMQLAHRVSGPSSGTVRQLMDLSELLNTSTTIYSVLPVVDATHVSPTPEDEWMADTACDVCPQCFADFTVSNRRHHCRLCGLLTCGKCSTKAAALKGQTSLPVRVCDGCYNRTRYSAIPTVSPHSVVPAALDDDCRVSFTLTVSNGRSLVFPSGVVGAVVVVGRVGDVVVTSEPSTSLDGTHPRWSRGKLHFHNVSLHASVSLSVLVGSFGVGTVTLPVEALTSSCGAHTWQPLARGYVPTGEISLRVDMASEVAAGLIPASLPPVTLTVTSCAVTSLPVGAIASEIDAYLVARAGLESSASEPVRYDPGVGFMFSEWTVTFGGGDLLPADVLAFESAAFIRLEVWDRRVNQTDGFLGVVEPLLEAYKVPGVSNTCELTLLRERKDVGRIVLTLST